MYILRKYFPPKTRVILDFAFGTITRKMVDQIITMHRLIVLLLMFFCLTQLNAQQLQNTEISLLTCSSGDELYTTFGHNAIRVKQIGTPQDLVFNYGTFSFKEPNFYLKFLRGKLNYRLAVNYYSDFIAEYKYFKRTVTEQVLDLNDDQKQKFIDFLNNNALPENRNYKYDFFFDNCSTRIRDALKTEVNVSFDQAADDKTFRNLLDENLSGLPWSDFGIDIVIGAVADRKADFNEQMYIPEYLSAQIDKAQINETPLVGSNKVLLDFPEAMERRKQKPSFAPLVVFGILALVELYLLYSFLTMGRMPWRFYDLAWIILFAILSFVIMFLWFATDHMATKENYNLIWLSPFFLGILSFFNKRRTSKWFLWSLMGVLISQVIFIISAFFLPQQFHVGFIPLLFISISLCLRNYKYHSRNQT